MSQVEKSAVKSLLSMHRTYADLDEYLEAQLKEAGYAGVDIQRNPVGTRITVFVTRPGLAIGRRGTGIKELTERVAQKFNLPNPQIAVSEVERPELNPRIMAQRTAQIVARGTAFRRAANWTMTTIMEAGAMGCEIGVAGKLRSDRAHKEKYRMGVVPKSGETADEIVRSATTDVLLKLGLFGIKVKIAIPDALPPTIEFNEVTDAQQPAAVVAPAVPAAAPHAPAPRVVVAEAVVSAPEATAMEAPSLAVAPAPGAPTAEPEAPKAKKATRAKRATKATTGTRKRATKKKVEEKEGEEKQIAKSES
ncbi:MAG TPA: 30S ribosomal protein S3 [Nitrososphaerales archaeon]|nr:30S ribosomal protein S3 [Nitrososphaerales archaeon]